jgi:hypothetical protein
MSAPKQSFDPPIMSPILDENGRIGAAWQQWADQVGKTLEKVRQAAEAMDDLDPGTATTNQIATAWEEMRDILQGIV